MVYFNMKNMCFLYENAMPHFENVIIEISKEKFNGLWFQQTVMLTIPLDYFFWGYEMLSAERASQLCQHLFENSNESEHLWISKRLRYMRFFSYTNAITITQLSFWNH